MTAPWLLRLAERLSIVDQDTVERILSNENTQSADLELFVSMIMDMRIRAKKALPKDHEVWKMEENRGATDDAIARALCEVTPTEMLNQYEELKRIRDGIVREISIRTEELFVLQKGKRQATPTTVQHVKSVLTPPGEGPGISSGSGNGIEDPQYRERLTTLLLLLTDLGIDTKEEGNVILQIGSVTPNMMRQLSYVSVYVPKLQKLIELCNEVGNRSFVWRVEDEGCVEKYGAMTKDEKETYLQEKSHAGWGIVMQRGWEARMRECLLKYGRTEADPEKPIVSGIRGKLLNVLELSEKLRNLLKREGICWIETRKEDGKTVTVLVWGKVVSPQKKLGEYESLFCTLLGQVKGVNGRAEYDSSDKAVPAIRELFTFDREEYASKQVEFEMSSQERQKEMLIDLLKKIGICWIETKKKNEEEVKELVWGKSVSPCKKFGGYESPLYTLLGKVAEVKGREKYASWENAVPAIRELFTFDREEYASKQVEFDVSAQGRRKEMFIELLREQEVCWMETIEEGGKEETVLVWRKKTKPQKKLRGYESLLCTLLGQVTGVSGRAEYDSSDKAVPAIRELFTFDREEYASKQVEFEMSTQERRKEMLIDLLREQEVCWVETIEEGGKEETVLVWRAMVGPTNKLGEYTSPLCTLLGQVTGVNRADVYISFEKAVPAIRSLFDFDREESMQSDA
jgi:hypothetical protein